MTRWSSIPLEDWMRDFYFDTPLDLGSSGVQIYSLAEVCNLVGLELAGLGSIKVDDSLTTGALPLRTALAERYADGDPERIFLSNGSNEAGFFIMQSLLQPEDEIVALRPIYHTLAQLARDMGCRVIDWPLDADHGFRANLTDLASKVSDRTTMITVNFPHNPTGSSVTPAELEQLVEIARSVNAYLIWDAAFEELTYGSPPLPNPLNHYEKTIVTGTLSKCYGLPGLRLGWVIADPAVIARFTPLRDYLSLYVSPILEHIATPVIRYADQLIKPRHQQAIRGLKTLRSWAQDMEPWVEWIEPMGGVTAFPRFKQVADTEIFCKRLAQEEGVMLVPGHCFGFRQHVRLGFGGDPAVLKQGLARLATFLKTVSKAP